MVQQVTIPFSELNQIPGVSGIDDVTFRVPEVEDIRETVNETLPSLDEIRDATDDVVRTALREVDVLGEQADRIVDDIVAELEDELGVDFPDPEELIDGVATEVERRIGDVGTVEIQGSLFSLEQDFVDILAAALSEADLFEVPQFPSLEEIQQALEDATVDVEELDVPSVEDITAAVSTAVTDALADTGIQGFVEDPSGVLTDAVLNALERAVSEDTAEELRADAEREYAWD